MTMHWIGLGFIPGVRESSRIGRHLVFMVYLSCEIIKVDLGELSRDFHVQGRFASRPADLLLGGMGLGREFTEAYVLGARCIYVDVVVRFGRNGG